MPGKDQKSQNSSAIAWIGGIAALITALAALFNALGASTIFPNLFEQHFQKAEISKTYQTTPDADEIVVAQSRNSAGLRDKGLSEVEAVQALRQGMNYLKAREILFSAGWQPIDRSLSVSQPEDVGSNQENPSKTRFGIELEEIDSCGGTGLGLCSGELELDDGRTVQVIVAQGENGPMLDNWSSNFYIGIPQETVDAVSQLQEGLSYNEVKRNLLAAGWRQPIVNVMHLENRFPNIEQSFKMQYPTFDNCTVESGEIKECQFVLLSSDKRLTIDTDVIKLGSEGLTYSDDEDFQYDYDVTIKSWAVE